MPNRRKIAVLAPGQGPHEPGMLEAVMDIPLTGRFLPLVNELAGTDVREALRDQGMEFLRRVDIVSVITVLVSASCFERWRTDDFENPAATAGYSIGQWSAMYFAGMLNLEQTINAVWQRAKFMEAAMSDQDGAMTAVIGLSEGSVRDICSSSSDDKHQVLISNLNAPGQITIAGNTAAVARAEPALTEAGARKVQRLSVAGAWHCFMLASAVAPFKSFLETIEFAEPLFPVIDNMTGRTLPKSPGDLRTSLAEHLIAPVLWQQSIASLAERSVSEFVEIGYGDMLTKYGVFIARRAKHVSFPGIGIHARSKPANTETPS